MAETRNSRRGCWTCKAHKVRCDRGTPSCQRCIQTSRKCDGYQDRLSWPNTDDKSRALTASSTAPVGGHRFTQYHFINSESWQVELHWRLCSQSTVSSVQPPPPRPILPLAALQMRPRSEVTWDEMLHYFHQTAYLSLVTFNTPSIAVRDLLMRILSNGNSDSEKGVYFALLAFSSLHRECYAQAAYLKQAALEALSASSRRLAQATLIFSDAICHVAACMLLCAFETLVPSSSSGEWLWYVLGGLSVIHGTEPNETANPADLGVLLEWFYYHYALSRFATRHWNHKIVAALEIKNGTEGAGFQQTLLNQQWRISWQDSPPTHAILSLLAEACDTLPPSNDSPNRKSDDEYEQRLNELRSTVSLLPLHWNDSGGASSVLSTTADVYQAAVLIYLKHASRGPWELSASSQWFHANSISALVDTIFERHIEVSSECKHFFPLLMIACEALTEERRATIMKCIERTSGNSTQGRNLDRIAAEIKHMWVQQDLYADIDLCENTQRLLSAVVSSNSALPSYA